MKKYVNQVIDGCRESGYVTTIAGRRRYLPSISSHKMGSRNQAERQAVNTTVQGSAADVIKLATINIDKQLSESELTWELSYPTFVINSHLHACI